VSDIKSGKSQIPFFEKHHHLLRRLHSLTGIVPIGVFLMSHLLTNGSIVWGHLDARKAEYGHAGVATFQHEVDFIHSIPFLFFIELSLWGSIAFHSILGVYYARTGAINTGSYNFGSNWRYRLQRLTGYIGIFFIIYHVGTLRWNWTFLTPGGTAWSAEFSGSTMAQILRGSASDVTAAGVAVSLGYLIGVSSLVFHFANGLWTSAITWGLTVSASAQRRWGYVCAGLGAGLMALGWAAVIGFATLDPGAARKTEENFRLRESREIEQIKETQSRGQDKVTQAVPAN
jgi:succinate dehydrogenase / fumarate reductase cytochrome b subunit